MHSSSGPVRSPQPRFSMAYRADGRVGRDRRNIDRWFCGSYRDYIPDQYERLIRYAPTPGNATARNIWIRPAVRVAQPYVLATTRVALGKFYKTNASKLPRNLDELKRYWDSLLETGVSAVPLTALPGKETATTYQWPCCQRHGRRGAENRPRPRFAFRRDRPPYGRGTDGLSHGLVSTCPLRWPIWAASGRWTPSTAVPRFSEQRTLTRNCVTSDLADGVLPHGVGTAAKYALSHGFGRGVRMGRG